MEDRVSLEMLEHLSQFLTRYAWIFNFANIEALELDVFRYFPEEWRLFLLNGVSVGDLKAILTGESTRKVPDDVRRFVDGRRGCLEMLRDVLGQSCDA
jgi:hypothetical protein